MITIDTLLDFLASHGGKIVSTASLDNDGINQARASNRMYVDQTGYGFVWEPLFYGGGQLFMIPETDEEIEWFNKWYPLDVELPEKLKFENIFPICEGAKCKIMGCRVCKNEMY